MKLSDSSTVYGGLSVFYDLFDLLFLLGGRGNPRSGLPGLLDGSPLRILEVCTGTAASAVKLAARCRQCQVTGIDLSPSMLAVARRKAARRKLTNLELMTMSADALQFEKDSFDMVMISFALHEFEADLREKIFREIARVLKPGGKFCAIDFARQANFSNRLFIKLWTLIEPACFTDFLNLDWKNTFACLRLAIPG